MDLNSIPGHKIAVNFAYKYCDYDEMVCFDDPRMHGFPEDCHTLAEHGVGTGYELGSPHGIDRAQGKVIQINSSMIMAINVAIHLGFKDIWVWGCDMELKGGYVHFYDDDRANDKLVKHYNRRFRKNEKELDIVKKSLRSDEKLYFMRLDRL